MSIDERFVCRSAGSSVDVISRIGLRLKEVCGPQRIGPVVARRMVKDTKRRDGRSSDATPSTSQARLSQIRRHFLLRNATFLFAKQDCRELRVLVVAAQ